MPQTEAARVVTADTLRTENEIEDLFGYKRGAIAMARRRGAAHPPFIRVGERAIRYRLKAVEAWLESRTEHSPADAA